MRRAVGAAQNTRSTTAIAIIRAHAKCDACSESEPDGSALLLAFSRDQLPSYGWVFPTRLGTANMGVGGPLVDIHSRCRNLKHMLAAFVDQIRAQGVALEEPRALRAHHLPHFAGMPKLVHPRAVLIGDAGSIIDPGQR